MAKTLVIRGANYSENKLDTVTFIEVVPCTGITLNKNSAILGAIGETDAIVASVTPQDTTDTIVWSSSDSSVASVTNGIVTAVKIGSTVITATCGTQTASCLVSVEVVPDFVVVGAFNPAKTSTNSNATYANCVTTEASAVKNAIIAGNSSNTNLLTVSTNSAENNGDYRFVPIQIPLGATKIKITSNYYKSGTTRVGIKTRMLWYNIYEKETINNYGALCLQGLTESNYDQDSFAFEQTVDIPQNVTGLNGFAVGIGADQWSLVYNTNYAEYFDVEFVAE